MANSDEDDEEEERPEELNDQLDLVPPAVCDVLPEQEAKLLEKPHRFQLLPGHDANLCCYNR